MAIDDNTLYGLTGAQIKELPGKIEAVKGSVKVLTTDDYNYPTNNPDGVALWLLQGGVYVRASGVKVYGASNMSTATSTGARAVFGTTTLYIIEPNRNTYIAKGALNANYSKQRIMTWEVISGSNDVTEFTIVAETENVLNNLTTTNAGFMLDARQGKVLKDFIGDLTNLTTTDKTNLVAAINEAVAGGGGGIIELTSADYNYPSGNPMGIAVWLLDEGIYKITDAAVYPASSGASGLRDWVIIVAKKPTVASGTGDGTIVFFPEGYSTYLRDGYLTDGSGSTYYALAPTVVQTTGTSQTDVMSQNAVTSMIFADPSTKRKVQIGDGSSATGTNATAVGRAATANANGATAMGYAQALGQNSVAIGAGASASTQGQFDIGTSNGAPTGGYNSSAYRLLTGLYDPLSAHDAATKGYVDTSLADKLDDTTTFWGQTVANGAVSGTIDLGDGATIETYAAAGTNVNLLLSRTDGTYTSAIDIGSRSINIGTPDTTVIAFDTASGGTISAGGAKIIGVDNPTSGSDAATKNYVDSVAPIITMQTTDPGEGAPLAANQFIGVYQ